jgi:hypothetical protein
VRRKEKETNTSTFVRIVTGVRGVMNSDMTKTELKIYLLLAVQQYVLVTCNSVPVPRVCKMNHNNIVQYCIIETALVTFRCVESALFLLQ